jgi:hypothetical protein
MSSLHGASGRSPSKKSNPSAREKSGESKAALQDDATQHKPNNRPPAAEATEGRLPTIGPNDWSAKAIEDYEEQAGLYDFAEELRNSKPPVQPWFIEASRLRRIHILWLNKRLAMCRKDILERMQPSDKDMEELGKVLHSQGKL